MTTAIPPIIVIEDGGYIEVYPTVVEATRSVEAEDIPGGVESAFDSTGLALRFIAHGTTVSLEVVEGLPPDPLYVEELVRDFIDRLGAARLGLADLHELTLKSMLTALLHFERGSEA